MCSTSLFSLYSEAVTGGVIKLLLKTLQYSDGTPVLESLFNKAAGIQV